MLDPSLPREVAEIMQREGVNPLKAWRIYRGLSVDYVARALQVLPKRFIEWENASNPCNSALHSLSKLYGCSESELMP